MKQVIMLEQLDINSMADGSLLTLQLNGTEFKLGMMQEKPKQLLLTHKRKMPKKVPCNICHKLISPMGKASHMRKHQNKREARTI